MVNSFLKGHEKRGVDGFDLELHVPRLCLCGCEQLTNKFKGRYSRFIKGHENIGRIPWNKGREFSEIVRKKMSLSRLGKEPANKIHINLGLLYNLYVKECKTASAVGQELKVSTSVIKYRIKKLGWSRSTKESCSFPAFREKMRELRIKTLTSNKIIETPNKLEKLVYSYLDKIGIQYQKQIPLFNKFVVDILFPQRSLVLEIFGSYWHNKPEIHNKDMSKKTYLEKCGYEVEELWDFEIQRHGVDSALQKIFSKYNMIN